MQDMSAWHINSFGGADLSRVRTLIVENAADKELDSALKLLFDAAD
jgi:hypothetical protein